MANEWKEVACPVCGNMGSVMVTFCGRQSHIVAVVPDVAEAVLRAMLSAPAASPKKREE